MLWRGSGVSRRRYRNPELPWMVESPYSFPKGDYKVPSKSGSSTSFGSGSPGAHPRARRVRANDAQTISPGSKEPAITEPVAANSGSVSSRKRRISIRLTGGVHRFDLSSGSFNGACFGCQAQPATVQAETASGWLTLCDACLQKARRAQVRFDETAGPRADLEKEARRRSAFARHGLLSGGGANGTGGRKR